MWVSFTIAVRCISGYLKVLEDTYGRMSSESVIFFSLMSTEQLRIVKENMHGSIIIELDFIEKIQVLLLFLLLL